MARCRVIFWCFFGPIGVMQVINDKWINGAPDLRQKKGLEEPQITSMFRPPFDSWAAGESRAVRRIKDRKQLFPRQRFLGKLWNRC
jgi:hypothetical protein